MGPDFLCIGAQRAGTTWLFRAMQHHPGIWLPPVKELHYFDHRYPPGGKPHAGTPYASIRIRAGRQLKRAAWMARTAIFVKPRQNFPWVLRYNFGRRDDRWYQSLFRPAAGQVSGEITPAYSTLDAEAVERVHDLLPEARILLIVRNPIERAWSAARKNLAKGQGRTAMELSEAEILDAVQRPGARLRGDFPRMLDNWGSHYDQSRLHVSFYDDMADDPERFLRRIYEFLGLDVPDGAIPDSVARRRNAAPGGSMPAAVRTHLTSLYRDDLTELARRLGGPCGDWLAEAEAAGAR